MSDSALLLGSQALTVLATSLAAIAIARTLDPDDWGIFSAFLGLSLALAIVIEFGLGTWLLRELSSLFAGGADQMRTRQRAGALVTSAVVVNAMLALPLVLAGAIWSATAGPGAVTAIALVSLLTYGALTATATALEAHMRARRQVLLVVGASVFEKSILGAALLVAIVADAGLAAIGVAYLVAGLSRGAFDAITVFWRHAVPLVPPRPRSVVALARASLPFALTTGSLNVIPRLDTFVLVTMSATSAAWFAIGDRVLGPALLVPATVGSALYPFMATASARRTSPWRLAGALAACGGMLALLGILLAPFLIPLLFGSAYRDAVPVAQVMLLALPIVYAASPLLVVAYSHGRERSLIGPILATSLAGTAMIIVGEALGGTTLAAAGLVLRSFLFLLVVGTVAFAAWRRQGHEAVTSDLRSQNRVSTQSP
ncbi:MAG: oligosaccharide flippase family protein [Gaiellaceae bacterium]